MFLVLLPSLALQFALASPEPNRTSRGLAEKVENSTGSSVVGPGASGPDVVRAQILLDRARFSPGEIDGEYGESLKDAVLGYQAKHGINPTGTIDAETWKLLNADTAPLLATYTVTSDDTAGPFESVPNAIEEQAQMKQLGYQSSQEKLGEKFHASPKLLAALNPGRSLEKAGEEIKVPSVERHAAQRATRIVVSKSKRTVSAFTGAGKLLAQYPATIGGPHDPLPIGTWKITVVKLNPWFYYNSERFWNAGDKDVKAKIAPGPNNPAGLVWMGLSKEHYGIHGTPEPGNIHHEESAGCIRMTNWDALDLARMVRRGTPAILEE